MRELKAIFVGAAAASFCTLLLLSTAYARAAEPAPQPFDIRPQSLAAALNQFARQSHEQILFSPSVVSQRLSSGVRGTMTPLAALRVLLKDSGLTYTSTQNGAILVGTPGSAVIQSTATDGAGESQKEGKSDSSGRFRVAQASVGETAGNRPVTAQQPAVPAVKDSAALQEIIVTAQKREEQLQNVPISMSVLNGTLLDQTNLNVNDVLNTLPGVATQQNYLGGGTVVVIRGVAPAFPTQSGSSPVGYYLDSAPFGLVKSAIVPDSDPFDLQRVEVLRGPQGTLYGANALNGVVRVLTSDPDLESFDFKARVSDSYTQYGGDNNRVDLAVNVPLIEGKLAIRAVAGYDNEDGWIDQPDKNNSNWSETSTYRLKIAAQPSDELSILLSAWRSRENAGSANVGYTFDKNSSVLDQPVYADYDVYAAKIGYQIPWFTVTSATSYLDYSNEGTLGLDVPPFNEAPSVFPFGSTYFQQELSHVFSEEININSAIEGNWRWSVGGIYRRGTEFEAAGFPLTVLPTTLGKDVSQSYAAYGELTREFLNDRLELTAGVRHFHDDVKQQEQEVPTSPDLVYAESTSEANTPRAVLTWHASVDQMLYASYSQGFRSGFPQDESVPAIAHIPPAEPDRLTNFEVGSKGGLYGRKVVYDVSFYYMRWNRIQQALSVFSPAYDQYTSAIVNGNSASGVGVDAGVSAEVAPGLVLKASGSWNGLEMDSNVYSQGDILFRKGERPNSSPETTASAGVDYSFALGNAGYTGKASASANYISAQAYRGVGNITAAIVQTGDPMVFSRLAFSIDTPGHWSAMLYGDNLNNERGSPVEAFVGTSNWNARVRPRTVGAQLSYHFK